MYYCKYHSSFHQKLAMGELYPMTSFVTRGYNRVSIFAASVQENKFLLLGFSATASTFQFNEVIIIQGMIINKIMRNIHQIEFNCFSLTIPYQNLLKYSKSPQSINTIQQPYKEHYYHHCEHQNFSIAKRKEITSRSHSKY